MAGGHEQQWHPLQEDIDAALERHRVPGAAVGLLHEGESRAGAFGVTNADHPLPVTPDTLFQIGSITKTFTATAIMRLVEANRLQLQDPVRKHLPDFAVADSSTSERVTVSHLLTHTSGWFGDLFIDTGGGNDALARYVARMRDLPQVTPLETVLSYNNAGFAVAGHIIEHVTEQTYEAALRELVLDPLQLERCYFHPGDVMTSRFAAGHLVGADGVKVARPWHVPRAVGPMGGICCSVHELLHFARTHLGAADHHAGASEAPLLDKDSLDLMQTPHAKIWRDESCGLAWWLNCVDGVKTLSHGGSTLGQAALLLLIPQRRFVVAVLSNADRGPAAIDEILRASLRRYLGIQIDEPQPVETARNQLLSLVGRYTNPVGDFELALLHDKLVGQIMQKVGFPTEDVPPPPPDPPSSFALIEDDGLVATDGPMRGGKVHVGRDADGRSAWLRVMARVFTRVT